MLLAYMCASEMLGLERHGAVEAFVDAFLGMCYSQVVKSALAAAIFFETNSANRISRLRTNLDQLIHLFVVKVV